jgi:hypothetical protein
MILQQEPYQQQQQQQQAVGRLYNRITPINNNNSDPINEDCFYTPPKHGGGSLRKKYPLPPLLALPLTLPPGGGSGGSKRSGNGNGESGRPSRSEINSILNHGIEIAMKSDDDDYEEEKESEYDDDWDLGMGHRIEQHEEAKQQEADEATATAAAHSSSSLKGTAPYCIPHRQQAQHQKQQRGGSGALSSSLYDYCDNGVVICQGGGNNKTTRFLAPISEERQVTFAAQHVVSRVRGSNERMVHSVLDAIQVWFIPHYTEYNEYEISQMWYTQDEMNTMRNDFLIKKSQANDRKQQRLLKAAKKQKKEQVCKLFSLSPKSSSKRWKKAAELALNIAGNATGDEDEDGDDEDAVVSDNDDDNCRRCRYETSLCAVLNEQYEQRLMCQQVYGRVDNGYSGIIDPDRLALVYTHLGDTNHCQRIAFERATKQHLLQLQEQQKQEQRDDDDTSLSSSSSSSSSLSYDDDSYGGHDVTTTDHHHHNHHEQQDYQVSSTNKTTDIDSPRSTRAKTATAAAAQKQPSTCFFTISSGFDICIDSLFEALLTPILDVKKGDIFLGIGEEMHLL